MVDIASFTPALLWKSYSAAGAIYRLAGGKGHANSDTALYIHEMKRRRGISHGGHRGESIDGN